MKRFTPADADARARAYLELIARGQTDSAAARLAPSLATDEARRVLDSVGVLLRDRVFDSTRVIGARQNFVNGVRHVNLSYEQQADTQWFLTNVATVDSAGDWAVEGFSARLLDRPLEENSAFTFSGKSGRHFFWLAATILCAALSVGTAVFIAIQRRMPKRWRWVLMSLLGIGRFSLDWSSGAIGVKPIFLMLGAAGFSKLAPVAPWILTFAFPIGAILALSRYRAWRAAPTVEPSPSPPVSPAVA